MSDTFQHPPKKSNANPELTNLTSEYTNILLFDGDCSLCNASARFIMRWERKPRLVFAALESAIGKKISAHYFPSHEKPDSIMLIQAGHAYIKSEAALRIAKIMGGFFSVSVIFRIIPHKWRDSIYDYIARKRMRWFGTSTYCALNDGVDRSRFLDL